MTLTTGTCDNPRVENKCGIDMAFDFHILCMAMAIGIVESRYILSVYGSNAQLGRNRRRIIPRDRQSGYRRLSNC
jgi:hypothetical protein